MNDLAYPAEWFSSALENLLVHVIGGDWGKDEKFEDADFVPVICIRGAEFRHWDKEKGSTATLRKIKRSSLETRKLQKDDILIEISGGGPDQPVGRTVLIDQHTLYNHQGKDVVCTNFLRLARPSKAISASFLNSYLRSFYLSGEVVKYQGGSNNLRNLKFKDYVLIKVPIPPLAEQKQIAERLEALLSQVETLKARIEAIPTILKRFRESVLTSAMSGKLTEPWRELVQNVKNDRVSPPQEGFQSLPETWAWKKLESVCEKIVDCPHSTPKWTNEGKICIRTTNIKPRHLDLSEVRYVSTDTFENRVKRLQPMARDVLYSREGGILGVACMIPPSIELCLGQRMMMFRLSKFYLAELLVDWLNSPYIIRKVKELTGGSASPHLNIRDIKHFPVPVPPADEQTEIVRRVEQLFAFADQIEQRVKDAQARVNHLTQSILAKAFRGELTAEWRAQNPDLISGENSAEALMARIQAERAAAKPAKRGRRTVMA